VDVRLARLACAAVIALPAAALAPAAAPAQEDSNLSEERATAIAGDDPKVAGQRREHGPLGTSAELEGGDWEVAFFACDEQVASVAVDDTTGIVEESWTGYQATWKMARGYEGSFGHKLNAPYVFLPLCALFLLGLVDWRRPLRMANLDLLVLLGFGISHLFFNRGEIGLSVPLAYPPLLYLMARMLWLGFRGRGEGVRPVWPTAWLLVAALFLIGFRAGLNVADSGVIDVGYASVVGADKLADGEPLYGDFPEDVSQGDTYGPLNYIAYVPFEQALPWSGSWDDLPAAHAAAIFFDLATFALLLFLGTRLRPGAEGRRLAATLGFGWAAYPYAAFAMQSNSNDTLVGLVLLAALAAFGRPAARGALAAAAGLTKFAPVIVAPLLATADGLGRRSLVRFSLGLAAAAALLLAPAVADPGLGATLDRTLGYQAGRDSPFSVWGQAGLEPLRIGVIALTAALAVLVAFKPAVKSAAQVAALATALLVGTQLAAQHWFYLYLVWFFPLALVALAAITPEPAGGPARSTRRARLDGRPPGLPSPRRLRRRSRSAPASV
jgi:hypothetical protein